MSTYRSLCNNSIDKRKEIYYKNQIYKDNKIQNLGWIYKTEIKNIYNSLNQVVVVITGNPPPQTFRLYRSVSVKCDNKIIAEHNFFSNLIEFARNDISLKEITNNVNWKIVPFWFSENKPLPLIKNITIEVEVDRKWVTDVNILTKEGMKPVEHEFNFSADKLYIFYGNYIKIPYVPSGPLISVCILSNEKKIQKRNIGIGIAREASEYGEKENFYDLNTHYSSNFPVVQAVFYKKFREKEKYFIISHDGRQSEMVIIYLHEHYKFKLMNIEYHFSDFIDKYNYYLQKS